MRASGLFPITCWVPMIAAAGFPVSVRQTDIDTGALYQFRLALELAQAKGTFKIMPDEVARHPEINADIVIPESAIKPSRQDLAGKVIEGRWFSVCVMYRAPTLEPRVPTRCSNTHPGRVIEEAIRAAAGQLERSVERTAFILGTKLLHRGNTCDTRIDYRVVEACTASMTACSMSRQDACWSTV